MSKQQIDFLTFTQLAQSGGGGGSPSNWANYPATNNVDMSNYAILDVNRIEGSNDLAGKSFLYYQSNIANSNLPIWNCVQTNGGGSNQPDGFSLWRGTYTKNDPFEQPTELFDIECRFDSNAGWTIDTAWRGYVGIGLTLGGSPLTFSVGANDSQQIFITSVNGGSGRLWVDSNGALYWNSNLIANA
jgi:hypothetical protein